MKTKSLINASIIISALLSSSALILSPQIFWIHKIGLALGLLSAIFYHYFKIKISRWVFNFFALLLLALSILWALFYAEYPIQSAFYFIGYLVVIRLFELETARDQKLALLLTFFEISASSLLIVSIIYLIILISWLVSCLFSLTLIIIARDSQKPLSGLSSLFGLIFSASIFSLVLGIFLFFLLPRLGFSLIRFSISTKKAWSGYAEQIKLGDVNRILTNRRVVMRVKLLNQSAPVPQIKWRIKALTHYENNLWSGEQRIKRILPNKYNQLLTIDETPPSGKEIEQEIYLEPGIGPDLPAGGYVFACQIPFKFKKIYLYFDHYISLPYAPFEGCHYLVYSVIPNFTPAQINQSLEHFRNYLLRFYKSYYQKYLELPSDSSQVCRLAKEIAGNAPDDYSKIQRIKEYLEKNYIYSLKNLPTGKDALKDFLFKSKKGNCEFFATSAVLMLRCLDIPSRLALGFVSGEWNQSQHYYLVRQSDAHTWAEVILPGLGFLEIDPTPAQSRRQGRMSGWIFQFIDPIIFYWNRWIVDFSIQDQLRGFRKIQAKRLTLTSYKFRISNVKIWLKNHQIWVIFLAILLLGFYLFVQLGKNKIFFFGLIPSGLSSEQKICLKIYLKALGLLKRKGVKIKPSCTGWEISSQLENPFRNLIFQITQIYYQARFGGKATSKEDIRQLKIYFEELKKEIKNLSQKNQSAFLRSNSQ